MNQVIIYTSSRCPYCDRAKSLLNSKGVSYHEINIENDPNLKNEMIAKSNNRKTVPQIFIGDQHVGGCDDLYDLDRNKKLDTLLNI
ncbi:MAG: glutaredoxin 3 [Rickettsiaceae bacterium]|nr:MAG: glutaredoxin 3 [Rickettsiaceae bacterium]